jgi:UDP-N-acetylglucosamine 2-epimerase
MKILVPVGCRSDSGLSAPVITRLRGDPVFQVATCELSYDYSTAYLQAHKALLAQGTDLLLVTGDRVEMTAAACAGFNNHVKIAHLYAGTGNNIATLDDVNRHVITLWSEIQFCESMTAAARVTALRKVAGLPHSQVFIVGITHLDDLELDDSLVPKQPYDLVLYNPPTYCLPQEQKTLIERDTMGIRKLLDEGGRFWIIIGPNPDSGNEMIVRGIREEGGTMGQMYETIPRVQFLGLLRGCKKFITNSSAGIYEAPHFLKPEQIVMIGERNRDRDRGPFQVGASDRIVEVLKAYAAQ